MWKPIVFVAVLALGGCAALDKLDNGKPYLIENPGWAEDANDWVNENILDPMFGLIGGP